MPVALSRTSCQSLGSAQLSSSQCTPLAGSAASFNAAPAESISTFSKSGSPSASFGIIVSVCSQTFQVSAHIRGTPRAVAGERGDAVPIGVVRIDRDHGIVGCATAQGPGARVEHTVHALAVEFPVILVVAHLTCVVGVVANE